MIQLPIGMVHDHHSIRYARCVYLEPHLESVIFICSCPSMYAIYYTKLCTPWQCLNLIMYTIYLYIYNHIYIYNNIYIYNMYIYIYTLFFGGGTSINPRAVLRLGEFQAKLCLRLAQRLGDWGLMPRSIARSSDMSRLWGGFPTNNMIIYIYTYCTSRIYNQIIAMTSIGIKHSVSSYESAHLIIMMIWTWW